LGLNYFAPYLYILKIIYQGGETMKDSSRPRKCCDSFPLEITGEYRPGDKWIRFECPVCESSTQTNPTSEKYKYGSWNEFVAEILIKRAMKIPGGSGKIAELIEANTPMTVINTGICPSCGSTFLAPKQAFCMACGQKIKLD